jgi:hypothetical protein
MYSKQQIRGAMLRAADRIEQDPKVFNFCRLSVPACGTPGCAAGWIGFELGIPAGEGIASVMRRIGIGDPHQYNNYSVFQNQMFEISQQWPNSAMVCASTLRAYADKYFPADTTELDPAFTRFRADFKRIMETA